MYCTSCRKAQDSSGGSEEHLCVGRASSGNQAGVYFQGVDQLLGLGVSQLDLYRLHARHTYTPRPAPLVTTSQQTGRNQLIPRTWYPAPPPLSQVVSWPWEIHQVG